MGDISTKFTLYNLEKETILKVWCHLKAAWATVQHLCDFFKWLGSQLDVTGWFIVQVCVMVYFLGTLTSNRQLLSSSVHKLRRLCHIINV